MAYQSAIVCDRSDQNYVKHNYQMISDAVCSMRACMPIQADWSDDTNEDLESRGKK